MSAVRSSRALAGAVRTARALPASTSARAFSVAPTLRKQKEPEVPISNEPKPVPRAQFPAPTDPFHPQPAESTKYSEGTKNLVRGVAKLMGYNSRASTAIRETGRMMRGVVDTVERDRTFWYDREFTMAADD